MVLFVSDKDENIGGKGENAGYQHFFPFPAMFSKPVYLRFIKSGNGLVKSSGGDQ